MRLVEGGRVTCIMVVRFVFKLFALNSSRSPLLLPCGSFSLEIAHFGPSSNFLCLLPSMNLALCGSYSKTTAKCGVRVVGKEGVALRIQSTWDSLRNSKTGSHLLRSSST